MKKLPTCQSELAGSLQKMGVSCAGQAGISGASLGQSKIGEARGATTPLTLPPSTAQVKAGAGDRACKEREEERGRYREKYRERGGGQSLQGGAEAEDKRWTNILIYLLLSSNLGKQGPEKGRLETPAAKKIKRRGMAALLHPRIPELRSASAA